MWPASAIVYSRIFLNLRAAISKIGVIQNIEEDSQWMTAIYQGLSRPAITCLAAVERPDRDGDMEGVEDGYELQNRA